MDGISTLTSLFIFMIAALYIALHNNLKSPDFIILLGLIATLFAFLFFNWSPSRMYMGDTGSQFLGIILAYIGIKYFWNSTLIDGTSSLSQQIWIFLIGFLLPITDTTIVTLNRILRGRSPFIGGRDHTTHNLVYFGLSHIDNQPLSMFLPLSVHRRVDNPLECLLRTLLLRYLCIIALSVHQAARFVCR
jgi:UDP-GlcNAc:undecaprenyl-phosphate/decaprenyl-phosphate GlcNAc-1-phosphate transferase